MTNQVQWSGITEPVSWPPVAEHTPGPWYIRDEHPGGATFNIGTTPADAYRNEVAVIFRTGKLPIHKANANLIAAAPELLVLAKQYAADCPICKGTGLVSIHFPGNEGVPEWDADDQPCQECVDIRAVIAKAEGR